MTDQHPCPRCGSALRPSAKFCSSCGATIATAVPPPPAPRRTAAPERHGIGKPLLVTGGCLFSGGLVVIVLLLIGLSAWGGRTQAGGSPITDTPAPPRPTLGLRDPTSQPGNGVTEAPTQRPTRVRPVPTTPLVVAPTEEPTAVVPPHVVGNWAIVNTLGALGYTFHPDGRFKRAILSETSDGTCTSTYEEVETGTATFDNGVMTLTITAGERHVYDTCGRDERSPVDARVEQYPWYANGEALNIDGTDYKRYE